jgi:membrane-bound ClpP family serine protease
MASESIGTVEVVLLIVGLVELIKTLGMKGKQVVALAFVIGLALGGTSYALSEDLIPAAAIPWTHVVAGALWLGVKGLAAAGLVKFSVDRVERVVGYAVRYHQLMQQAVHPEQGRMTDVPVADEMERWVQRDEVPL